MADDSITILEGTVKFRDGKKWKGRWGVLRRLSPVADAVELALYAECPGGGAGGRCKATVSLVGWVGCVGGFPLDRQAHTLALLVAGVEGEGAGGAVVALESRAALLQWTARVEGALGGARRHHVAVVGGAAMTSHGTLLLTDRRMALVVGTPPTVRAVWELQHLRRFGVVSGRFVWEAGVLAGAGAAGGVHCAASDDVTRLAEDVRLAARGLLAPRRAPPAPGSPHPARTPHGTLTRTPRHADAASPPRHMPRCVSCSAALCAGAGGFSPAWSMPPPRPGRAPSTPYDNYDVPRLSSIETEGEYYDTPRRVRGAGSMSRSVTAGALGAARGAWRDDVSELYAVVDVTSKRRARCDVMHYENGAFARSLRLYENVRPRASSAEYLPMRWRAPPAAPAPQAAGYARMAPAPRARRRVGSDPLLVDEEGTWGGRGGNRDSSSSGDSGVGGCEGGALRRCRSCEVGPPLRAPPAHSASAEGAVPLHPRARSRAGDTRSTSSGASDLSDYMETLSLSSHSSSDAHRLVGVPCRPGGTCGAGGGVHTTLRPRSGREYARPPHLPAHTPQPPLPPPRTSRPLDA